MIEHERVECAPAADRRQAQHRRRRDSRAERTPPSPRLAGLPDPGDAAVANALAAARAREQAARERLAAARAEKAAAEAKAQGQGKGGGAPAHRVNTRDLRILQAPRFGWQAPARWGLSARLCDLFVLMVRRSWETPEELARALFGPDYRQSDARDVMTLISDLRFKLSLVGIYMPRRPPGKSGAKVAIASIIVGEATRKAWGLPA